MFASEDISGEYLVTLDEEMLEDLGITKKLHKHKFKRGAIFVNFINQIILE